MVKKLQKNDELVSYFFKTIYKNTHILASVQVQKITTQNLVTTERRYSVISIIPLRPSLLKARISVTAWKITTEHWLNRNTQPDRSSQKTSHYCSIL